MGRRSKNYGYFNPAGIPAPPEAIAPPQEPLAPRRAAARAGMKRDLSFMRQVIGGMVGFAGTNTIVSLFESYLSFSPLLSRIAAGGTVYGASWLWSMWSSDSPNQKSTTRNAVLLGVAVNIGLYLLTQAIGQVKSSVGVSGYVFNANPPTPENSTEYGEEYAIH